MTQRPGLASCAGLPCSGAVMVTTLPIARAADSWRRPAAASASGYASGASGLIAPAARAKVTSGLQSHWMAIGAVLATDYCLPGNAIPLRQSRQLHTMQSTAEQISLNSLCMPVTSVQSTTKFVYVGPNNAPSANSAHRRSMQARMTAAGMKSTATRQYRTSGRSCVHSKLRI